VSCFSVSSRGLKALDTELRSLSPALNQPTPPIFINQTASDIFFNPASTALFAIVKGNTQTGLPATFFAWPIINGKVSTIPVISQPSDLSLAFGATFIDNTHIWLADVAFGAAELTVQPDFHLQEIEHVLVAGEQALCWVTHVPSLGNIYLTDGAKSEVTVLNTVTARLTIFDFNTTDNGGFDNVEYQKKLYVLTGIGTVNSFDLTAPTPSVLHSVDVSAGDKSGMEGLALWPAS
jgi:hypothetical protein